MSHPRLVRIATSLSFTLGALLLFILFMTSACQNTSHVPPDVRQVAREHLRQLVAAGDLDPAPDMVAWLRTQADVEAAELGTDGRTVVVYLKGHSLRYLIYTDPQAMVADENTTQ